ncbi:hypothetical protein [Gordonia sp. (in: high G+C Gram-positive bacteria)]|uniref:hypothetical protein n=1 Tax=Gordonia sp. (in: high G+C Gram-positive bacteria) TaxID=84139 RepID=UPI003C73F6AE
MRMTRPLPPPRISIRKDRTTGMWVTRLAREGPRTRRPEQTIARAVCSTWAEAGAAAKDMVRRYQGTGGVGA